MCSSSPARSTQSHLHACSSYLSLDFDWISFQDWKYKADLLWLYIHLLIPVAAPVGRRLFLLSRYFVLRLGFVKLQVVRQCGKEGQGGFYSSRYSAIGESAVCEKLMCCLTSSAYISPLRNIQEKTGNGYRFGKQQKNLWTWKQVIMLTLEPEEQVPIRQEYISGSLAS